MQRATCNDELTYCAARRGGASGLSAAERREAARAKRRLSKLKLKQRRASATTTTTSQATIKEDAGNISSSTDEAKTQKSSFVFNRFGYAGDRDAKLATKQAKKKIDGADKGKKTSTKSTKLSGRDYRTLLNKVEARERRVDRAAAVDQAKADAIKKKHAYDDALARAAGKTVKVSAHTTGT